MRKALAIAFLGFIFLVPLSTKAAVFRASESGIENIAKDQSLRNAYVAGSTVNVDGDIQKDLYVAGSTINLNGQVEDDLAAVGNSINVRGGIGGSARIAGSSINIDGDVQEDLLAAGSEVTISDNSRIFGDLIFAANKGEIRGDIDGDVKLTGSEIVISGTIRGNVLAKDVSKLTVKDTAVISGKLTYHSPNEANIESGSQIAGGVEYSKTTSGWDGWRDYSRKMSITFMLYQAVGSILLLLLFAFMAPKLARRFLDTSFGEAFRNLWMGLIVLIVTPILSLILLAISFKLAIIAMLIYILFLMLASSFSALLVGSWVIKNFRRSADYAIDWQSIVVGVILVTILSLVTFVGPIFLFVIMLISLGALLKLCYDGLK